METTPELDQLAKRIHNNINIKRAIIRQLSFRTVPKSELHIYIYYSTSLISIPSSDSLILLTIYAAYMKPLPYALITKTMKKKKVHILYDHHARFSSKCSFSE